MGKNRLEAFSDGVLAIIITISLLAKAVGRDLKGKRSPVFYGTAIPAAFFNPWIAGGIYVFVALMWLIPDRRIERVIGGNET
jgi:uncharacterized membrane protein